MRLSPNDPMMWPYLNLKGMILFDNEDYQAARDVFQRASEYPNAMFWILSGSPRVPGNSATNRAPATLSRRRAPTSPGLSVANVVGFMGPAAEKFAYYIDPMRKAGLPEK